MKSIPYHEALFIWELKCNFQLRVESDKGLLWFYPIRSVIGQENSRHFRNQSDAEPKLTATWSPAFFPRLR